MVAVIDGIADPEVAAAVARAESIFATMPGALVTLSGGVDSSVALALAVRALGARARGFTARSPTLAEAETEDAARVAGTVGAVHEVVESREMQRDGYRQNRGDRCFHCKSELYDLAGARAAELGAIVVDGTILDDLGEHRPGLAAAAARGVRHPLVEAGMDKAMVRRVALALGLPNHDKPAAPCLGSRVAVGTEVTLARVQRVAAAERALRAAGLRVFRARVHEVDGAEWLRVEVEVSEIPTLLAGRDAVVRACRAEGFQWITMDLEGYRRGSTAHRSARSASATG
jgi:uncharacterized protein